MVQVKVFKSSSILSDNLEINSLVKQIKRSVRRLGCASHYERSVINIRYIPETGETEIVVMACCYEFKARIENLIRTVMDTHTDKRQAVKKDYAD